MTITKLMDYLPTLDKTLQRLGEWEKKGYLDQISNLLEQGMSLYEAVQKADLINTLVSFGLDQIGKLQAFYPLLEKLTDEKTTTALQEMDLGGLLQGIAALSPLLNKFSDKNVMKSMEEIDWAGLMDALGGVAPLIKKFTDPETMRALNQVNWNSLFSLMGKLVEMQNNGSWDNLMKLIDVLGTPEVTGALSQMLEKLSKALKEWSANVPKVKPVGTFGLLTAGRNPDVGCALGLVLSFMEALGKSFRQ